ncbi:hypothetical protein J596_3648 [Acinetobacter baumannii 21072]|uniref:Uncharacterized protein n=1 Tax=Acinetobacter baumannii 21072 TaxID=1310697 RepID=A0A062I7C2_ACIBA|nr:hypothetical protein J596_3648 [Acinetobacter baumannii 21072]
MPLFDEESCLNQEHLRNSSSGADLCKICLINSLIAYAKLLKVNELYSVFKLTIAA